MVSCQTLRLCIDNSPFFGDFACFGALIDVLRYNSFCNNTVGSAFLN